MRASIVIWLLIAFMAVLAAALYPIEGMSIAMDYRGIGLFLLVLAVLCGLTRHRYPAAAHIALTFAQIVAFARIAKSWIKGRSETQERVRGPILPNL